MPLQIYVKFGNLKRAFIGLHVFHNFFIRQVVILEMTVSGVGVRNFPYTNTRGMWWGTLPVTHGAKRISGPPNPQQNGYSAILISLSPTSPIPARTREDLEKHELRKV